MATSRYFDATDAVISMLKGAGLTVWDGPIFTEDYSDCVFVGYDGDPENPPVAATLSQEWEGIGAKARREDINIVCAVVATSGEQAIKITRDKAKQILATVETTLRADPSLGMTPPPFWAGVQPLSVHPESFQDGTVVRIVFQIVIRTRV